MKRPAPKPLWQVFAEEDRQQAIREAATEATARGVRISLFADRLGFATGPWREGDEAVEGFVMVANPSLDCVLGDSERC